MKNLKIIQCDAWSDTIRRAADNNYRFAGIWATEIDTEMQVTACFKTGSKHIPIRNRNSGLAQIDPSSLEFPLGGNESSLRSVLDIHDSSERGSQQRGTKLPGANFEWRSQPEGQQAGACCKPKCEEYILWRTTVKDAIHSLTPYFPAANRMERHMHDMFGVELIGHPDKRRWTRHQAWNENQFPLRHDFNASKLPTGVTLPDADYPFNQVTGNGVYEIPVGPVHAGIIEPGHFRFHAAGEDVINLEERLGYIHKGIEKIAVGKSVADLIKLAGRVSGDSTVAHAWAAAQACESALDITVPHHALLIRAIMCERERIANHLGDIGAICNDVGFSFAFFQLMRLKELWLRTNARLFGHRMMMDAIIVGGVKFDIDTDAITTMHAEFDQLKTELEEIFPILENNSSLHDRLKTTGVLTSEVARRLGVLGFAGRASGASFDLRHDVPYAPYDQIKVTVPLYAHGDVLDRTRIRAQEIFASLAIINDLLEKNSVATIHDSKPGSAESAVEGIGLIEGWRGETLAYVRLDSQGKVARYFPRDPSWFSWPALEELIHNNIVPDFPVCNKSINASYSGVDL